MKVLNFFKDIPGWAKGIILIIIVLLVSWIIYKFYKNIKPKSDEEKAVENEKDQLVKKGQKPTFGQSTYQGYADRIQTENMSFNTDEEAIYGIFKTFKNDLDVILLIQAFGQKRPYLETAEKSLPGFLAADLNRNEIGEINKILQQKGIKYRF
jgi:hypothetical protein